jgi:2-dehydropantoate 2-reductase
LGAALARSGAEVVLLLRPESLARYRGVIAVDSAVLGRFEATVAGITVLDRDVDVVWITPKATDLQVALALAPADAVKAAWVIPLMNGVDHMAVLRARFERVLAGSIRVASVRGADGLILQTSPFIKMDLAGDGADVVATEVSAAGIDCAFGADETTLLWQKLAFLAPLALATTAADAPLGVIRHDAVYTRAQAEVLAVARAQGALIDLAALEAQRAAAPDTMRSSMQHDVEQGRIPELDAIAGPVLRAGREHSLATPAIKDLVGQVRARAESATS